MSEEIRVGVSACLLGEKVRYDGRDKRDALVNEVLAKLFHLVPVCPEVEIGLGTPREPIHIVRWGDALRLVGVRSGADHTEAMHRYAALKVRQLEDLGVSGFILKKDSPSCGREGVVVHGPRAKAEHARGFFAESLVRELSTLPVEQESALADEGTKERFVKQVVAYHRLHRL